MMSFSKAVKGFCSTPLKLHTIESAWETEFGEKMTDLDTAMFSKHFTIEETYNSIQKVLYVIFKHIENIILSLVWIWIN